MITIHCTCDMCVYHLEANAMRLSANVGLESTINIRFHCTGTESDLLDCLFSSGQCLNNSILAGVTCVVIHIISTTSLISMCNKLQFPLLQPYLINVKIS